MRLLSALLTPVGLPPGAQALLVPGATIKTINNESPLGSSDFALVKRTGDTLTGALEMAPAIQLASASTVNIGGAASNRVNITGTTTINAFDTVAVGVVRTVVFTGILALVHNAALMILPGGMNIVTAADDTFTFESLGSGNWKCIAYMLTSGKSLTYNQNPNPALQSVNGGPLAGFRNLFCNGDFSVWQRGTSAVGATGANFTGFAADRWQAVRAGFVNGCTYSRQLSGDIGSQYCARVQRDVGNALIASIMFGQTIETVNSIPYQGKTVTFSFRARAGANFSASGSLLTLTIMTGTGVDQNPIIGSFTGQTVQASNVVLTSSWATYSLTVPLSSSMTQLSADVVYIPTGTAGVADYFEIGRMHLEVGGVATPLEIRPYGVELALCQRYYEIGGAFPVGIVNSGVNFGAFCKFAVPKRALPIITQASTSASNVETTTHYANGPIAQEGFLSYRVATVTGGGQYTETWTASAEL